MTTLRIAGVPEPYNLPWHLGLERRSFIRAKIALKWRTVPQGTGAMCELLRKGAIDLAVLVEPDRFAFREYSADLGGAYRRAHGTPVTR